MDKWKILPDDDGIRKNATMLAQPTINLMDHDGIVTVDPVALEVELAENSDRIIDAVGQTILDWREGATRTLIPTYLNTLSLKKARRAPAELGGNPTVNTTPYRVDGEIRRLTFSTDALTSGSNMLWNSATDRSRSVEDILGAYHHDNPQIEGDFRLLKAVDCLRIQPIRHWTDSKIRVYALICVLSLLVLKLLARTLDPAELHLSPDVLRTELADIEAVYLEMAPGHIRRVLTQRSTVQQQIFDILGLGRYESSRASATVPLHTFNG